MRVGIGAYLLHRGEDYRSAGVSVYTHQLLASLPSAAPQHAFEAFVGADAPKMPQTVLIRAPIPTNRPIVRVLWEQTGLPIQVARRGVDVLHGAVNVLPELYRGPTIVTVHDLSFLRYPDRLMRRRAVYLRLAVSRSARRATRIITVSRNTANDVHELLSIPEDRIVVVYPGVDPSYRPLPDARNTISSQIFGGRPYILTVGTLEPRKNHDVIIRAFANLRRRQGIPHVLALVGARGWMYESLFELVARLGLSEVVRFVQYVAPADLPLWYNGADLFAYPSAYEGFGLPVLEAMACGLPTITSSSSSLKELAANACLTVEPGSEEELTVAMSQVLQDADLRSRLRHAGLGRAAEFSWERTARETVSVYESAGAR